MIIIISSIFAAVFFLLIAGLAQAASIEIQVVIDNMPNMSAYLSAE